ncbi:MAG: DnaB-like helicase C-terminal domain-containing protein [Bacteroidota bacterium]
MKIVFVDYLQIMHVANISKNAIREQVVAAICRGLKEIAKELKITVVAGAQLNRSVDGRGGNKRPQLQDLRESGSIEQDSDIVLMLYSPAYYGMEFDDGKDIKNLAEVIVAKNRHGRT